MKCMRLSEANAYLSSRHSQGSFHNPGIGVEKPSKIGKVMHEYKKKKLHIGKSNKLVKSRKQAVAIAMSEAGMSNK